MTHLIDRFLKRVGPGTLAFVTKINIFGLGLMVFWTVANITLLPMRVDETARGSLQGSALGLIGFLGVGFAVVVQPIAGRVSDAWPGRDKRRPFIVAGMVLVLPGLVFFGAADTFGLLLFGFVLMQFATNIAQAGFQAFIPDLVDQKCRGIASGAKNVLSVLGAALGLLGAQLLSLLGAGTGWVVVYIGVVLMVTGVLTVIWVPRIPGKASRAWRDAVLPAMNPVGVVRSAAETLHQHETFRWGVMAQFLFMLGTYPAQRYLLLFLKDRFGGDVISKIAIGGIAAIVLAVVAAGIAGALSDVIGRPRVLMVATLCGGIGMLLIGFSQTMIYLIPVAGLVAVGYGAFLAVNWALLNDDLPEGESAAALGVANIATAGAGAMAGFFGPVVDVMNAWFPQGTYQVLFGLAGAVALLSLMPLRRLDIDGNG